MKENILIFGTGGHAKVVYDALLLQDKYHVFAFVSLEKELTMFENAPHYNQDRLSEIDCRAGIVAVGDNFTRKKIVDFILKVKPDFKFVSVVHPSSSIAKNVVIGKGVVAMANACVNSGSSIGDHVILNTSSSVDHDNVIADFASIAPGAVLGGNVKIGYASAVSLGSNIIHGVTIGEHVVIGAGSLVLKNVESNSVAYGQPAKFIKKRQFGDKYL